MCVVSLRLTAADRAGRSVGAFGGSQRLAVLLRSVLVEPLHNLLLAELLLSLCATAGGRRTFAVRLLLAASSMHADG